MINKVLSFLGVGLLFLISLLPFWMLYIIADGIYILLYYIIKYRRHVVSENLSNSFPDKNTSERALIEKKFYRHLADLIVETIKMLTIPPEEVVKRVNITNPELLQDSFKRGKSIIGVLGHYGNWELNALRFSQLVEEPRIIIYKPLSNATFDKLFLKMRSRLGATLIAMKATMRKLAEFRNSRTITVMLGDQTPAQSELQYFTKFLNQPTAVFLGIEKLAKMLDNEVIFCDVRRVKRGFYKCSFVTLFTDPKSTAEYEITKAHVTYLEKVIEQEPAYWLWSHKRWKYKQD